MIRSALSAMMLATCAACASVAGDSTPPPPPPPTNEGVIIAGGMQASEFDNDASTLRVQIPFSGPEELNAFVNANAAVLGYLRFDRQADVLYPAFTAFAKQSTDGSLYAVVAADGGQFFRFTGGALTQQNSYTPTTGLARYEGGYVGVINIGPLAGGAPVGAGEATPRVSSVVTGHALLNADFTLGRVEGRINDRVSTLNGNQIPLQEIVLIETAVGTDGRYEGSVEQRDESGNPFGVGTYSGAFGGTNGAAVAGMIALNGNFIDIDDIDDEQEFGIFVLDRCTTNCTVVVNP